MVGGRAGTWSERGQGLILAVLGMAVFLGFVAMSVDVGLLLNERRTVQNAADAAALAGAAELPTSPDLAVSKARDWAAKNGIASGEIQSVEVRTTHYPNDTLYVKLNRNFNWIFARVLGFNKTGVPADASALIGSPVGMVGLKPWAVKNDVFLGLKPGDDTTLKYSAQDVTTGNFQPIRLDGQGSNVYRNTIENGSTKQICVAGQEQPGCPSVVQTETGNMTGPTDQGVKWIEQNTQTSCDAFGEVFTPDGNNPDKYLLAATCNPWSTSQPATLVAIVPVINQLCNGTCNVTILRFAMFFITGIECSGQGQGKTCNVKGKYVKAAVDIEALVGPFDPQGSVSFVRLVE